jgi:hypothetical protein
MSRSHIFTLDFTLAITRRRGLNLNFLEIIKKDMEKVKHEDKTQQKMQATTNYNLMLKPTCCTPHNTYHMQASEQIKSNRT